MSTRTAIDVLQAILKIVRLKKRPTLAGLVTAVRVDEPTVRRAVFTLAKNGLVQRTPAGLALTLLGLAIAVASPARSEQVRQRPPRRDRRAGQVARPRTTPPLRMSRSRPQHAA